MEEVMKLQKLVTLVAAVLFLAVSSMAFANVQISVGSNSQPIPYAADPNNCNKGGDLSFNYPPDAEIVNGDAFTMDLDFGTSLCKDVDLWYLVNDANILAAGPVLDGVNAAMSTGLQIFIHVKGTSGQRRVNVSFHGDWDEVNEVEAAAAVTVASAVGDLLRYRIFNQQADPAVLKVGPTSLMGGSRINIAEWTALPDATIADNTLCVQHTPAQIAENEKINFNLNRSGVSPSVFEFVGGQGAEPQIGHFISRNYALVSCDKVGDGRIECGSYGQDSSNCVFFDYEGANGYCSGYSGNKVIVEADPTFDAAGDYYFDIKIKVNGNYADSGVYFSNIGGTTTVGTVVGLSRTAVCDASASNAIATGAGNPYTWYRYGEATGVNSLPAPTGTNTCVTVPADRLVRMTTPWSGLGLSGAERFMWIDLPAFRYDLSRINAGDVVSVEIELRRTPCVLVATFEKTIGTLCCEATPETQATELIYPYFTQMAGDNWWDGIVVTNLSSTAGTAALSFYEQDGDRGTYTTPSIAAYSMYVSTLENLLPMITPAVGNAGALGNARVWIKANTNFSADGFAMIAEPTSGQSMGYLPRKGSLQ